MAAYIWGPHDLPLIGAKDSSAAGTAHGKAGGAGDDDAAGRGSPEDEDSSTDGKKEEEAEGGGSAPPGRGPPVVDSDGREAVLTVSLELRHMTATELWKKGQVLA